MEKSVQRAMQAEIEFTRGAKSKTFRQTSRSDNIQQALADVMVQDILNRDGK